MSTARQVEYETHFRAKKVLIQKEIQRLNPLFLPSYYSTEECNSILDEAMHARDKAHIAAMQCISTNETLAQEIYDEFYQLNKIIKKLINKLHCRVQQEEPNNLALLATLEIHSINTAVYDVHAYPADQETLANNVARLSSIDQPLARLADRAKELKAHPIEKRNTESFIQAFPKTKYNWQAIQQFNLANHFLKRIESNSVEDAASLLAIVKQLLIDANTLLKSPIFTDKIAEKLKIVDDYEKKGTPALPATAAPVSTMASSSQSSSSTMQIATQLNAQNTFGLNIRAIELQAKFLFYNITEKVLVADSQDSQYEYVLGLDIDGTLAEEGSVIKIICADELIAFLQKLPDNVKVVAITSRYFPDQAPHPAPEVLAEIENLANKSGIFHSIFYTSAYPKTPVLQHLHDTYLQPLYPNAPHETKKRVSLVDDLLSQNIVPARIQGFNGIHVLPGKSDHITQMHHALNLPVPKKIQAASSSVQPGIKFTP